MSLTGLGGGPTTWEYLVLDMEELKREEQLAALNDAGRKHWELVCVLEFSRAYLKRPKEYASELPPARVISDEEHSELQLKRHRDETRFRY